MDAVLALRPQRLGKILPRLNAVRAFSTLAESPALAAANKRIGNILKKAGEVDAHVSPKLLQGLRAMEHDNVTVLVVINGPGGKHTRATEGDCFFFC